MKIILVFTLILLIGCQAKEHALEGSTYESGPLPPTHLKVTELGGYGPCPAAIYTRAVVRVDGVEDDDIVKIYSSEDCSDEHIINTKKSDSSYVDIQIPQAYLYKLTIYSTRTNSLGTSACSSDFIEIGPHFAPVCAQQIE